MKNKLVMLVVLDGYGLNELEKGNAIMAANTPNMDRFMKEYPNTIIHCSGLDVGLPEGQMGNSEVGHTNIGAGRIVYQELTRITKSIKEDEFYHNEILLKAIDNCKKHGSKLHLFGLLSDGGVHSHNTHLYALLELAKREGLEDVYVHCFLDGRDVPPTSGREFVQQLIERMRAIGIGQIATVMGRYYSMDRDNRWERVQKAYEAMVLGAGPVCESAVTAVERSYNDDVTDEFVIPTVITKGGKPTATIEENDSIIFFNFRPDRAREITRTFVDPEFKGFERKKGYFPVHYVCMTQYDAEMPNVSVAFKPQELTNTFGEYISKLGYRQLRIAETEKYAHVTFFFNGGVEAVYEGEDRVLIPSPKVATYDMKPEMSAYEVTEEVVKRINSKEYDVIILNYANCDMVGHTGVFEAAVKAVEAVDECIGRVVEAVQAQDGIILITADHGNSDQMIDYVTGGPHTAHTTNVVPLILIGKDAKLKKGRLADIAPTMLDIMGLEKPKEMTGESLLK
ncbi:MAG: 2,3-bisphosphoglycerate-independent phosphoglycerate mutase [Petroclostridium sp.]|uniref:2,3-bisphosphoglycerate-independent phosphoglycerate mutase n=1 Tax=Petroclostridium xylanilyticum TaxID=1792311 RepID=UPI000B992D8D|nr:2,3-bisphosphoglycerate-independent phosphoglycerate mutase [Petroclostridium xylanilyticum]MBZ4646586.1 2,3-bisphosphoglycerate-independent phosphoglycerate mutase [Clostridia bacterium]MDK2811284.1 2,3-bisphosphoglycerate-independent phosphoglycerate mutase [Petroclostridium sp.]